MALSKTTQLLPQVALLLLLLQAVAVLSQQSLEGRRAAAELLANASVAGVLHGIRERRFTCEELISEQLRRIDAYNAKLHAFIAVNREGALAEARVKDQRGSVSEPLHCVPVAVKDNMDVIGLPTTSGARALQNMTAVTDSTVASRIKAMGGIIIGKANMAEMSDSGTISSSTLGGLCANPWELKRSCLGSSGGSSAAVAAGLAVLGIGTDTEGSVIGPCAAAGLLCLRPTQNIIFEAMREGVYPAFHRQDLVGIMARSRLDYLAAHDAIYGVDYLGTLSNVSRLQGETIRFLSNFYASFPLGGGMEYSPEAEMVRLHNQTFRRLANLDATIQEHRMTPQDLGSKLLTIFAATEAKPNCSRSCMKKSLDHYFLRYATTGPFRRASDLGSVVWGFPADYVSKLNYTLSQPDAEVCGTAACGAYDNGRTSVTAVLTEMMGNATVLAVPFTAKLPQLNTETPSLGDQISPALNPYTGWPSVALPVGFSTSQGPDQPDGLPVSMVLMAPAGQETRLLSVANAYLRMHPELLTPATAPMLTVGADGGSRAGARMIATGLAATVVAAVLASSF